MDSASAPTPSPRQVALLRRVEQLIHERGYEPPTVAEVVREIGAPPDAVLAMIALGLASGSLVQVAEGLTFHADVVADARRAIAADIGRDGHTTVGRVRDLLGSSRKYVVPLLEYLDRQGFTQRQGDRRVLAPHQDGAPPAAC